MICLFISADLIFFFFFIFLFSSAIIYTFVRVFFFSLFAIFSFSGFIQFFFSPIKNSLHLTKLRKGGGKEKKERLSACYFKQLLSYAINTFFKFKKKSGGEDIFLGAYYNMNQHLEDQLELLAARVAEKEEQVVQLEEDVVRLCNSEGSLQEDISSRDRLISELRNKIEFMEVNNKSRELLLEAENEKLRSELRQHTPLSPKSQRSIHSPHSSVRRAITTDDHNVNNIQGIIDSARDALLRANEMTSH